MEQETGSASGGERWSNMRDITKYQGIIPAFYACYEEDGSVSRERTKALAEHLLKKGVKGV